MNTLSGHDEDTINNALACSLGFKPIAVEQDNTIHTIWEGPLGISYYRLFVPQFCSGWKNLRMLVKAMEICGFNKFQLQKLAKGHWIAGFTCNYGPCPTHGTDFHNWHGSETVFGENPAQAAAFAAIIALASGTKVTVKRMVGEPDVWPIKLDDAVSLVNKHIKETQVRHHPWLRDWVVVNGQLEPPDELGAERK